MKTKLLTMSIAVIVAAACMPARADLASEFAGFNVLASDIGVSGLQSSYHTPTKAGQHVSGLTGLPTLGPSRVNYAHVGEFPSPGGSFIHTFDEGMLGVQQSGGNLVIKVATGMNPLMGYVHTNGVRYGVGDMFIEVSDSAGIHHLALLNSWAKDGSGGWLQLDGGHFNNAQAYHYNGGNSREGHLVQLPADSNVVQPGGSGAYTPGNAPAGLDMRGFVQNGADLGATAHTITSTVDSNQTWYLQTWTVDLSDLSLDNLFTLALHQTLSCGNDQIGGITTIPAPGAIVLGLLGMAAIRRARRIV